MRAEGRVDAHLVGLAQGICTAAGDAVRQVGRPGLGETEALVLQECGAGCGEVGEGRWGRDENFSNFNQVLTEDP